MEAWEWAKEEPFNFGLEHDKDTNPGIFVPVSVFMDMAVTIMSWSKLISDFNKVKRERKTGSAAVGALA